MKRISLKERLPHDGEECLIVVPSISVKTRKERLDVFHGNFYAEELSFATCEEGDFFEGEYAQWMPMPELPGSGPLMAPKQGNSSEVESPSR